MPHDRTGASTSRSGASARVDTSKRTWSLPLPGAAVRHRVGTVLAGRGHQVLDDHRPRQRRDQRVAALVERVGLEHRHAVVAGELVAGVDHDGLDRAGAQRPLAHDVPVVARLADVDGQGDDLDAHVVDHPAHGHRRVEAAAVGQHHSLRHWSASFSLLGDRGGQRPASSARVVGHGRTARCPRPRPRRGCRRRRPCRARRAGRTGRAPRRPRGPTREGCAARPGWPSGPPRPPTR